MRIVAAEGYGCDHCEVGRPIERIKTRAGHVVKLCLECVRLWFPGRSVDWWEERHAPFRDHVGDALDAAIKNELARAYQEQAKRRICA